MSHSVRICVKITAALTSNSKLYLSDLTSLNAKGEINIKQRSLILVPFL
jgi:hypothetical protein